MEFLSHWFNDKSNTSCASSKKISEESILHRSGTENADSPNFKANKAMQENDSNEEMDDVLNWVQQFSWWLVTRPKIERRSY